MSYEQESFYTCSCVHVQAVLEREQLALQAKLMDALQSHVTPVMQLDTSSPIDRTVALLDEMLVVCSHDMIRAIAPSAVCSVQLPVSM